MDTKNSLGRQVAPSYIPPVALYAMVSVFGLVGLLGNILGLRMTRHPQLQRLSYRVHLSNTFVVNSLELIVAITLSVMDVLNLSRKFLTSHAAVCKLGSGLILWLRSLTTGGILALALDRYVALVLPRFKATVCTCTGATLLWFIFGCLTLLTCITYSFSLGLIEAGMQLVCADSSLHVEYFGVTASITALLPCFLALCLAVQLVFVLARRGPPVTGSQGQQPDSEKDSAGPLVALVMVSWLTSAPKTVCAFLMGYTEWRFFRGDLSVTDMANSLFPAYDFLDLISCAGLAAHFYILLATGPYFRRLTRQSMQRGMQTRYEERVDLPGDRRVLTAFADGSVVETISGQVVDLEVFNAQRERDQISRQPSSSSSICSNVTNQSDIEEHYFGNGRRHGYSLRHSAESSSLDRIVEAEDLTWDMEKEHLEISEMKTPEKFETIQCTKTNEDSEDTQSFNNVQSYSTNAEPTDNFKETETGDDKEEEEENATTQNQSQPETAEAQTLHTREPREDLPTEENNGRCLGYP